MQRALCLLAALPLASLSGLAVPAVAQPSDRNWELCENSAAVFSPPEMIAACTAIIQSGAETPQNLSVAYSNRGAAYAKQGNHAVALADYDEAVELDPGSRGARFNRALARLALEDYPGAAADLDEVIGLDPQDWEAFHARGHARLGQSDAQGAWDDFSRATRLTHLDSGPIAAELYSDRGLANLDLRDYDAAISDYGLALQKNALETAAYLGRATAHLAKKNWQFAFEDLSRFVESNPAAQPGWTQRCLARLMLGHARTEAVADCDRGRNLAPTLKGPYAARALLELKYGDWQRAFDLYDAGIAGYPNAADLLYGRGIARVRLGDVDGGWDDIARATGMNPGVSLDFADFGIVP